MCPVIVCMLSNGFNVNLGVLPAAIATIIVSPTALEIPRIKEAITPDVAAGSRICVATSKRVAPRRKPRVLQVRVLRKERPR